MAKEKAIADQDKSAADRMDEADKAAPPSLSFIKEAMMAKEKAIADQDKSAADRMDEADKAARASEMKAAEDATAKASDENRLPETMAVTEMDSASGAFVEPEIKAAAPVDHPAVENNPREGTSAVQNGGDFNDPRGRHPSAENFAGQGLDLSVYGENRT